MRPGSARSTLHTAFRALPPRARKHLVRLGTPNYTLGAVVLVRDERSRLLVLRHPGDTGWSLPGGLLGRLEEPHAAACRELAEETGLRPPPGLVAPTVPTAVANPRTQQVDWVFTTTVDVDPVLHLDPVEVAETRWSPVDALPLLTWPTARLLTRFGIVAEHLPPE